MQGHSLYGRHPMLALDYINWFVRPPVGLASFWPLNPPHRQPLITPSGPLEYSLKECVLDVLSWHRVGLQGG